ncbi:hypothetical protein [Paractinoplanes brasiliensis]|uniref:Uncharacterized protein n=1 Tax=Paractinoplanes brasiliensis TaxID=52695 RepID=A0A4R6J7S2_9ACTN|nr:hypothetical protein [Actinoplanes brasiliensis]TDO31502.1 hypothetical protein C8E87_6927 [Actinoplanes brasiliensis]GID30899.1 hypothetical protein Abr02nite_58820 [Actinoplanes brasiliensis]
MIRRSGLATVGMAMILTTAGCGSDSDNEMVFGGDPVTQCVRVPEGASMVVGEVVRAPAGADLVVQKVGLVDARNVAATEAFIVPLGSGHAPIASAAYPPAANSTWGARMPAANATIRAGEQANLLVVVERPSPLDGSAAGMRIDWLGGSKTNTTTYEFRAACGGA